MVVDRLTPESLKKAILSQLERRKDEFNEGRRKLYALFDLTRSVDVFFRSLRIGDEKVQFYGAK